MAKKVNGKTLAIERLPSRKRVAARENVKAPSFFSVYANDIQLQTSPWDVRFIFGSIAAPATEDDPTLRVTQLGELHISPQLAARLVQLMSQQLAGYEEHFGKIPSVPR